MIKKRKILFWALFILWIVAKNNIYAQVTPIKASVDSTELLIGNQTVLTFTWEQRPSQKVKIPIFSDTIVNFLEIVEKPIMDTTFINNKVSRIDLKYRITSFEDTLIYVRPMPFLIGKDTLWSNSLSLKIIQPFHIDLKKNQLIDIKPIYNPPFGWKSFIKITLLVILLVALFVLLFFLVRKYLKNRTVVKEEKKVEVIVKPTLSPYDEAVQKMKKLDEKKLWQNQHTKEYYTELTNILRVYIQQVFNVHCMEMTSDEILASLSSLRREKKDTFSILKEILILADLVKFAKWTPQIGENERSIDMAYRFLEETHSEENKNNNDNPFEKIK